MTPVIEIRDLTVRYGDKTVLDNVSFSAAASERIAILGPSGSGKTSLMRAINGFVKAASGTVRVNGVEVTAARGKGLRKLRSQIGFVSQRHDLVDSLSVLQNVMAGELGRWSAWHAARFLVWPNNEELDTAREALRQVGLESKLRARTATLSGGEHQRVAIARALVQRPVLLLADEPVASLDPQTSEQILELLSSLAEQTHVTLICTLHQPELATRYFNRIISVRGGQVTDSTAASLVLGANL